MKLPAPEARAIARRSKTTLRVPVDPRLLGQLRPVRRSSSRPFNPAAGDIVPIDAGGRTYCKVLDLNRGPLGTLTEPEALDEGYPTVNEFEIAWVERHERAWLDRQVGYLVDHGVPQRDADETRDSWAKVRYDQYWTIREVWVLHVIPFDDMPYLLPGLVEEPESIPVDRLKHKWATKAAGRYEQARHEEERVREARQLGRRLRSAKLRDPRAPEIVEIEAALRQLETRYSQAA